MNNRTLVDRLRDHQEVLGYDEPLLVEAAEVVERLTAQVNERDRAVAHLEHTLTEAKAEVKRLTRELDEMRAMWDQDSAARHRLTADLAAARKKLDEAIQVADHHAAWRNVAERQRDGLAKAAQDLAAS